MERKMFWKVIVGPIQTCYLWKQTVGRALFFLSYSFSFKWIVFKMHRGTPIFYVKYLQKVWKLGYSIALELCDVYEFVGKI